MMKPRTAVLLATVIVLLNGCAVIAVTDAVVTTGAVAVKSAAKVTGAVVDVATYPFRSDEQED